MDWKSVRKPLLLILSLGFFVGAGLNFFIIEKGTFVSPEERYAVSVRKNVGAAIVRSVKDLSDIISRYHQVKGNTFADYELATRYPYYIFRNRQLIYWSDHHFVPPYQAIAGNMETFLLSTENAKYIVNGQRFNHNGDKIEIYSLVNLYRRVLTEEDYNRKIFSIEPENLLDVPVKIKYLNITDNKNRFLFSVVPPQIEKPVIPALSVNTLLWAITGVFLLGIYFAFWIIDFVRMRYFGRALALLAAYLIFIRLMMLANGIPFLIYGFDLFNPRILTVHALAPSLGALLLNAIVGFLLLGYVAVYFYKSNTYYKIFETPAIVQHVLSVLAVAITVLNAFLFYRNLSHIYQKSAFTLEFTLSVYFSSLKIAVLLFYIITSCAFFLTTHLLCCLFLKLNKELKMAIVKWLVGVLMGLLVIAFIDRFRWVYVIGPLYFLILYIGRLPRFFYSLKYKTTLYFISGAFVSASIAVFVIMEEEQKRDFFEKQEFAKKYLEINDKSGEQQLVRAVQTIEQDTALASALARATPTLIPGIVERKIADFKRYDISILVFNKTGRSLNKPDDPDNFDFYQDKFHRDEYKTADPHVFLIDSQNDSIANQYVAFIPVSKSAGLIGYVVLILKDNPASNAYQKLHNEEKLNEEPETQKYSYAIFDEKNQLIFNAGNFNYGRQLPVSVINGKELYEGGIVLNGYRHVGKSGQKGYKVVISSEYSILQRALSNFSFLFFLSILFIAGVLVIYALIFSFRNRHTNFTGRVQLYLNGAFLLPVVLTVMVIIWVIKSTFVSNQDEAYLEITQSVSSAVQRKLESFNKGGIDKATLMQEIEDLAHDKKLDINIYNLNGRLNLTSQSMIHRGGLLSDFINAVAYRRIVEEEDNTCLLTENQGSLSYKTAYMLVKGHNGKPTGIIGVPFFDAKAELDRPLGVAVASVLNTFTLLFLILLIVSYFVGRQLTKPLRTLAHLLKKTDIDELNEKLNWSSEDEIGLLMKAYNKMLKRLEDSKTALAQSQKQTAWREMAKQVAHEIKNPLTPMKLSIQQLQRTLTLDNPKAKERIERALNSLTEQIDNISEIANSFSEFAKMPVPRNDVFDLVPLIRKSADLYAEDEKIALNAYIKERTALVIGDRQFMSRVITNLIINGIQSVPAGRRPIINLRLYKSDEDKVIIEIQDNGSGIPENHRQKVFRPNFTTKVGGSGLGLAMARRGVEHAGGNIWFETENGRGTTFFIDLPLKATRR